MAYAAVKPVNVIAIIACFIILKNCHFFDKCFVSGACAQGYSQSLEGFVCHQVDTRAILW